MVTPLRQPFGEVIASTLDTCTIQAWEWGTYPPFGSLITIQESPHPLIAIVHSITTTPLDAARMPVAYKKTEAELKAEHPHIFSLLRTTLTCTTLAALDVKNNISHTPFKPATIHGFASEVTPEQLKNMVQPNYMRRIVTLLDQQSADSLIYQYLTHQKSAGFLEGKILRDTITEYVNAVGNDYKRIFNFNCALANSPQHL